MMTQLPRDSHPSTNAHPPRFSRRKPAPAEHFLQTIAAKGLHPTLFLAPTSFTSLLDGEGQNPENSQACARTILDVKGSISFNQKKKKKEKVLLSSRIQ